MRLESSRGEGTIGAAQGARRGFPMNRPRFLLHPGSLRFAVLLACAGCGSSESSEEHAAGAATPPVLAAKPPLAKGFPTPASVKVVAKNATVDELVETCFNCIRGRDWETYSAMTITVAEIAEALAAKSGAKKPENRLMRDVLRPGQEKALRAEYDRALTGMLGQIDFNKSEFAGLGAVVDPPRRFGSDPKGPLMTAYSVKLKSGAAVTDSKALSPHFVVVPWEGKWRLLALKYPKFKRP